MKIIGTICYLLAGLCGIGAAGVVIFGAMLSAESGALIGLIFAMVPALTGVGLWLLGKSLSKASETRTNGRLTKFGKVLLGLGLIIVAIVIAMSVLSLVSVMAYDRNHVMSPLQRIAVFGVSTLVHAIPGLILVLLGLNLRAKPTA